MGLGFKSIRLQRHGTRCAGEIAAVGNNSVCMVGIAHNARIGGIRMLDGFISDRLELETLTFRNDYIDIYSGSWGPEDTGRLYEGPGALAQSAFQKAVALGRNGFGNIFVWASGNGGTQGDSCACDGYASCPYTLSVNGVGEHNSRPWYLEQCSSTLVTTYSSGSLSEKMIMTLDPNHQCTSKHTGTSASAPMAAGIIALLLEANPRLSWRDVQYLTLLTANPRPFVDGNFTTNAVGRAYSQLYGYGLMDAGKLVRLGELWRGLPEHHLCTSRVGDVKIKLVGSFNYTFALNFSGCLPLPREDGISFAAYRQNLTEVGHPVRYLEHVQLYADIAYQRRGLLQITLISPSGTETVLQPPRVNDEHSGNIGLLRWPLTTVQLWGESPLGVWHVRLDNRVGYNMTPSWQKPSLDQIRGFWSNVWLVAYGTDEFPIRLRPPNPARPPPQAWFAQFSKYVVDDSKWYEVYSCHVECAPGGCTGPGADQCLGGCRHFATQSRLCVATCPRGTTPYGALRVTIPTHSANWDIQNRYRTRIKPGRIRSSDVGQSSDSGPSNVVCQPCWTLCASCLRPHTEYDCTSCSNGRYLVPLITPSREEYISSVTDQTNRLEWDSSIELPSLVGTCRTECPVGFYANKNLSTCVMCIDNCAKCVGPRIGECLLCAPGFRLIHGRCVHGQSVDGRCSAGQYLKQSVCVDCPVGCERNGCLLDGQCVRCKSDFPFLFSGTCVKSCPLGWFAGLVIQDPLTPLSTTVSPPSTSVRRLCEPCPPGCQSCTDLNECTACLTGFELQNDRCVIANQSDVLLSCKPPCSTCFGQPDSCVTCPLNYSLMAMVLLNKTQLYSRPTPLVVPHKLALTSENRREWSVAVAGSGIIPIHSCFKSCPPGTYLSQRIAGHGPICRACSLACILCSDQTHCLSCRHPFYFDNETSSCLLGPACRYSEYFDRGVKACLPCDPTCATCHGPLASECTSCAMRGPSPRCLHTTSVDRWQVPSDVTDVPIGNCIPCCAYKRALLSRAPTNCMFCVASQATCLSGSDVGAGEGLLVDPTVTDADSLHSWFTKEPSRLVLTVLCIMLLIGVSAFIIVHATQVCRKRRIHDQPDTAATRRRHRRSFRGNNTNGAHNTLKVGDESRGSPLITSDPPRDEAKIQLKTTSVPTDMTVGKDVQLNGMSIGKPSGFVDLTSSAASVVSYQRSAPSTGPHQRVLYTKLVPTGADEEAYTDDNEDDNHVPVCTTHAAGEPCTRAICNAKPNPGLSSSHS
ncbi:hypothetical protein PHET_02837 [Paragonimus heterotremus]|uniref:P/Homo B domain-containing protein n=1 Tax=Paragonimus heterotremus TaxID=100268 RepID=A0A8J4X1N7_9TREM|nr:hypothetical protein PHET_02837 [Paragonimus heterotremus]